MIREHFHQHQSNSLKPANISFISEEVIKRFSTPRNSKFQESLNQFASRSQNKNFWQQPQSNSLRTQNAKEGFYSMRNRDLSSSLAFYWVPGTLINNQTQGQLKASTPLLPMSSKNLLSPIVANSQEMKLTPVKQIEIKENECSYHEQSSLSLRSTMPLSEKNFSGRNSTTPRKQNESVSSPKYNVFSQTNSRKNDEYYNEDDKSSRSGVKTPMNSEASSTATSESSKLICNTCINKELDGIQKMRKAEEQQKEITFLQNQREDQLNRAQFEREKQMKTQSARLQLVHELKNDIEEREKHRREQQRKQEEENEKMKQKFRQQEAAALANSEEERKKIIQSFKDDAEKQKSAKLLKKQQEKRFDDDIREGFMRTTYDQGEEERAEAERRQAKNQVFRKELVQQMAKDQAKKEREAKESLEQQKKNIQKLHERDRNLQQQEALYKEHIAKDFHEFWQDQQKLKKEKQERENEREEIYKQQISHLNITSRDRNIENQREIARQQSLDDLRRQINDNQARKRLLQNEKEKEDQLIRAAFEKERQNRMNAAYRSCDCCHTLRPLAILNIQRKAKNSQCKTKTLPK